MRFRVNFFQTVRRQVRIDLRRGKIHVPQKFLHRAKVRAAVKHMRRERMPEHVRMDFLGHGLHGNMLVDDIAHTARGEPSSGPVQEYGVGPETARVQISLDRRTRLVTQRNDAFFLSFSKNLDHITDQVDILRAQSHQLADTDTRGIKGLKNSFIAQVRHLIAVRRFHQLGRGFFRHKMRQDLVKLGRLHQRRGVLINDPLTLKIFIK